MRLAQCVLFDPERNHSVSYNDKCSGKDGNITTFQVLPLKQRCPTCVRKALAARIAERKNREEREKNAERRGERGEVVRYLRMEDDEEKGLTPLAIQRQFAGAETPAAEETPQLLMEVETEVGLGIYL